MKPRAVHQVLVGAGSGDAVTSMALAIRTALRGSYESEIYAQHISPEMSAEVLQLSTMGRAHRGDVLIYHSSIGEPSVTQWLLRRTETFVLIYHNITPPEHFVDTMPSFAANLLWGRHELELLRARVALAVAVSDFNAADLERMGYEDVRVVAAGLKPSKLRSVRPVGRLAEEIRRSFPHGFVLSVSQVLPHKRFESLIEAMHLVQWVHEVPLGLAIVGTPRHEQYDEALRRHAARLGVRQVWFFGRATDGELATFYRLASMFVTTSAHEGLAIPPLEAMSFRVPVIARSAGAIESTIGGAGIVLPDDAGPSMLSEAIVEVATNGELRDRLRVLGDRRVEVIESADPASELVQLVQQVS